MKIGLINPKPQFLASHPVIREMLEASIKAGIGKEFTTSPSPALLTIASLTPKQHEVDYIDDIYEQVPFDTHYDIIGLSAHTRNSKRAYEIATEFKKRGVYTVLGGTHATLCTDEASKYFDTVVVGEAEALWPSFLEDFSHKSPKKIYRNSPDYHAPLEKLPCPAYDKVKTEYYQNVAVLTQRGCPSQCCFCTIPPLYGNKMRQKSIESVVGEVKRILELWDKKPSIYFGDENFFIDRQYAKKLIEELKPLKIKWNTKATVDICEDEALLDLAYESGLRKIQIGFESIDPVSLKQIGDRDRKLRFFEKYERFTKALNTIQKYCITVVANFVFGFDNEDISIFENTKRFILENPIAATRLAFLVPFPGTGLYKKLKAENRLYHEDWEKYINFEVLFKHPKMKKEDMENEFLKLFKEVSSPERAIQMAAYFKDRLSERLQSKGSC